MSELDDNDHRRLGPRLNLFHIQDDAAGSIFWHEKGWTLYQTIESYIRSELKKSGYGEVRTPQLYDRSLFEASGHWGHYAANMFMTGDFGVAPGHFASDPASELDYICDDATHALKPMNCPAHVQIFNKKNVSYRQLPLRMAEFGCCHRKEPSGALHGMMRLRQFTQDDAHIFCSEDQVGDETLAFIKLLKRVYEKFGFDDIEIALSTRPADRAGDDQTWDKAEGALEMALVAAGCPYTVQEGEGAFYGPKIEFALKDKLGRSWQCGTIQLDFVLPKSLDAFYTDRDGERKHPVMLHRAILGSIERFIAILLEHHEGKLPVWLAPAQAVVIPVGGADPDGVRFIMTMLGDKFRVVLDDADENVKQKVKDHSLQYVPLIICIGPKELAKRTYSVRKLGDDKAETVDLTTLWKMLSS